MWLFLWFNESLMYSSASGTAAEVSWVVGDLTQLLVTCSVCVCIHKYVTSVFDETLHYR